MGTSGSPPGSARSSVSLLCATSGLVDSSGVFSGEHRAVTDGDGGIVVVVVVVAVATIAKYVSLCANSFTGNTAET